MTKKKKVQLLPLYVSRYIGFIHDVFQAARRKAVPSLRSLYSGIKLWSNAASSKDYYYLKKVAVDWKGPLLQQGVDKIPERPFS